LTTTQKNTKVDIFESDGNQTVLVTSYGY